MEICISYFNVSRILYVVLKKINTLLIILRCRNPHLRTIGIEKLVTCFYFYGL